jgi:hypothetical protein
VEHDVEDQAYNPDDRSGDEASDTDKEFESIVEIETIIKSITESSLDVNELHEKIIKLFAKLYELRELIEFDSDIMKDTFENMIAKEILYFTSFAQIVRIADLAYKMQVPYPSLWHGLCNTLLINYHDMDLRYVVPIIYYLGKIGMTELTL